MRPPSLDGRALLRAIAIAGSLGLLALDGRPGALLWLVLGTAYGIAMAVTWRWPRLAAAATELLLGAFGVSAVAWGVLVGVGAIGLDEGRGWQLAGLGVAALVLPAVRAGALLLWPGLARHRAELLLVLLGLAVTAWGLVLRLVDPGDGIGAWARFAIGATAVGLVVWYRLARWLLAHMDWVDRPRDRPAAPADPDPRGVHRWPD